MFVSFAVVFFGSDREKNGEVQKAKKKIKTNKHRKDENDVECKKMHHDNK